MRIFSLLMSCVLAIGFIVGGVFQVERGLQLARMGVEPVQARITPPVAIALSVKDTPSLVSPSHPPIVHSLLPEVSDRMPIVQVATAAADPSLVDTASVFPVSVFKNAAQTTELLDNVVAVKGEPLSTVPHAYQRAREPVAVRAPLPGYERALLVVRDVDAGVRPGHETQACYSGSGNRSIDLARSEDVSSISSGSRKLRVASTLLDAEFGSAFVEAAKAQMSRMTVYNDAYFPLAYPGGDVPTLYGVCTDVVIRAYRGLGLDLQRLVFEAGMAKGGRSIAHRRTSVLRRFFARHGLRVAITEFGEDYLPGDIVTYDRPQNSGSRNHIAIVSDETGPSGDPMIIHNRGWGVQQEDALFMDRITGHYRYRGPAPALVASTSRRFSPLRGTGKSGSGTNKGSHPGRNSVPLPVRRYAKVHNVVADLKVEEFSSSPAGLR
ncbi:MAG: DUF1287 domain-containing protein [Pseudomonadota bacterium]